MHETLLSLEEEGRQALLSGRAADFYRTCLTEDALMVVPGMVVDKATFLLAVAGAPDWASFEIEPPRVVELTRDCAAVLYKAIGRRTGQPDYVALMSSIYVNRDGSWKLAYHQQTPVPG